MSVNFYENYNRSDDYISPKLARESGECIKDNPGCCAAIISGGVIGAIVGAIVGEGVGAGIGAPLGATVAVCIYCVATNKKKEEDADNSPPKPIETFSKRKEEKLPTETTGLLIV